jgi:NADH-quinone oxidoreductase subunit H
MDTFDWLVMGGKIAAVALVLLHVAPIMAWVERRGSALMQNRLGPNRIGPLGLLQSLADGIKFMFKEDVAPGHVIKPYYYFGPIISLIPAFMTLAAVPFGSQITIGDRTIVFQIANLNAGLLYIFAIASLGVYGIIMGAWASNNKYSLLGGLRSTSQMISYELSLGLSVIGIVMVFSSIDLNAIAHHQSDLLFYLGPLRVPKWGVFVQPLGFLIFLVAIFAETNRLPFDLPEGESEIVAGYHLEYGSMKFATYMMAEYNNMFVGSALCTALFFGGWQMLPGMHWLVGVIAPEGQAHEVMRVIFEIASFGMKVGFFMWFFVWVRWTLPRFRYDQLMNFGWKVMLPLSLVNIFATGVLIYYGVI